MLNQQVEEEVHEDDYDELGAGDKPRLVVFNKADLLERAAHDPSTTSPAVAASSRTVRRARPESATLAKASTAWVSRGATTDRRVTHGEVSTVGDPAVRSPVAALPSRP